MSVMTKKQERIHKVSTTDAYFMQDELKQELRNYINTCTKDVKIQLNVEYDKEGRKRLEKFRRKNIPHNKRQYQIYFVALIGMFCILSFNVWFFLPVPLNSIMSTLVWLPMIICLLNYVVNKRTRRSIT